LGDLRIIVTGVIMTQYPYDVARHFHYLMMRERLASELVSLLIHAEWNLLNPPPMKTPMNHCFPLIIRKIWARVKAPKMMMNKTEAAIEGRYSYWLGWPFGQEMVIVIVMFAKGKARARW
jgi:hypothetical protein